MIPFFTMEALRHFAYQGFPCHMQSCNFGKQNIQLFKVRLFKMQRNVKIFQTISVLYRSSEIFHNNAENIR